MSRKGHKAWNKGLTKETDTRVARYSESLKGHTRTEEHCRKISEKAKQREVNENCIKAMNKAWSEKCKNNLTEEQKQLIIALYLTPMNIPQVSKRVGLSYYYVKKTLKEFNIPEHSEELKNKLMVKQNKKSKLEKYGDPTYTNVEKRKLTLSEKDEQYWLDRKQKVKDTVNERYGVNNVSKIAEIIQKGKQTKLERYGDENYNNREKSNQTNIERYGVANYSQSDEFINKRNFRLYKLNNISFDSFPELCVYLYCINNNIKIERNKIKFKYFFENKLHYCFVDFVIDNKLVEVKGDYLYQQMLIEDTLDNAKLKCLLEHNVEIWTSKEYNFYIEWFEQNNYNIKDYIVW